MTTIAMLWTMAGAIAGVAHGAALWRSTRKPAGLAWSVGLRLPAVAAVLTASALAGSLAWATAGWACGLAGTGTCLLGRGLRWPR